VESVGESGTLNGAYRVQVTEWAVSLGIGHGMKPKPYRL
jgi:hypothetical protein